MTGPHETEIAQPITAKGKPQAVVVRMSPFCPQWPVAAVRSQVEQAFPGVPVIFVDQGTTIEVVHAVE